MTEGGVGVGWHSTGGHLNGWEKHLQISVPGSATRTQGNPLCSHGTCMDVKAQGQHVFQSVNAKYNVAPENSKGLADCLKWIWGCQTATRDSGSPATPTVCLKAKAQSSTPAEGL